MVQNPQKVDFGMGFPKEPTSCAGLLLKLKILPEMGWVRLWMTDGIGNLSAILGWDFKTSR